MPKPWFRRTGRFCAYPVSIQGWVVSIVALVFFVHIFIVVDRTSHSVTDTLYGVFPYLVPTFLLWEWIVSRTTNE